MNGPMFFPGSGGYALHGFCTNTVTITDGATYFFGSQNNALQTASAIRTYIPRTGIIVAAYLQIVCGAGTTETGTGYIRLNNTTDTTVFNNTLTFSAAVQYFTATGLAIPVVAGDYIEFKILMPTFATNPSNMTCSCVYFVEAA